MAKIIYLKEKWIVEWHEKLEEERFITHKEFFYSKKDGLYL